MFKYKNKVSNRSVRNGAFLVMAALVTAGFPGVGSQVRAQTPGDSSTRQSRAIIEEVYVTAQRVEESLQETPVAVTSLDEEALENARVFSANDLQGLAPNLWIVPQSTSPSNPSVTIRGVNSNISLNNTDGGIAFYIDGVYMASNVGAVLEVADIERVEILRGPQGTLYGRNSTGGAINFITRSPTGELGLRQDLSSGNYDLFSSRTRIDTPEWNNLSATFTYFRQERDGDVRNITPGRVVDYSQFTVGKLGLLKTPKRMGGIDSESYLVGLLYTPTERLRLDYRYGRTESENVPKAIQVLGFDDGGGGNFTRFVYSQQPPGTPNFVSGERLDAVSNPYVSPEFLDEEFHTFIIDYQINDWLQVKNIASHRELENSSVSDLGGGGALVAPDGSGDPFTVFTGVFARDNRQTTEELQFLGTMDKVDWIAGVYYSEIFFPIGGKWSDRNHILSKMPSNLNGGVFMVPPEPSGFVENKHYAIYGQGTWHYSEKIDITLGGRQSRDERTGFNGSTQMGFDEDFSHFDWTAILNYFVSEDLTTYGKVTTGYLSGGVAGNQQVPFDPEEVLQVELGVKGDFLGQRLRTNVATFWSDYTDIQVLDFSTGVLRFVNAAEAEVFGLEAEITAVPIDGLTLGFNYGYTYFDYKEFTLGGVDVKDTQREWFRPEHTANVNAEYRLLPFSWGGEWSVRLEGQYLSRVYFIPVNSDPVTDDNAQADPRWIINARTTLANIPIGDAVARVALWVKNLGDEDELEFAADIGTTVIGSFTTPRTYGVDFTIEY